MRPSGRSRGSVLGRKKVTTLSRIAARQSATKMTHPTPISIRLAGNNASILRERQLSNSAPPARVFARRRIPRHAPAARVARRGAMKRRQSTGSGTEAAAGNGLLDRRALLAGGAGIVGLAAGRPALGAGE